MGALRFKVRKTILFSQNKLIFFYQDPLPIKPWQGTWRAIEVNKCLQGSLYGAKEVQGGEDCLYLNVYVPILEKTEKFDVIVHLHGGGFMEGSGSSDTSPPYLMDRDIIYVTIHYRLAALGK